MGADFLKITCVWWFFSVYEYKGGHFLATWIRETLTKSVYCIVTIVFCSHNIILLVFNHYRLGFSVKNIKQNSIIHYRNVLFYADDIMAWTHLLHYLYFCIIIIRGSTSHRRILFTKDNDVGFWCFLWCSVVLPVISAMRLMWPHCREYFACILCRL